jgi:hypothetical protein
MARLHNADSTAYSRRSYKVVASATRSWCSHLVISGLCGRKGYPQAVGTLRRVTTRRTTIVHPRHFLFPLVLVVLRPRRSLHDSSAILNSYIWRVPHGSTMYQSSQVMLTDLSLELGLPKTAMSLFRLLVSPLDAVVPPSSVKRAGGT